MNKRGITQTKAGFLIINVVLAVYQILDQTGLTVQETLRKVDTEVMFQFIAKPGLTNDPRITIYQNDGTVKLVDNVVMTEKNNEGVYESSFTPTELGFYTAVMRESAENNIQVTEIVVADGDIQSIYEKIIEMHPGMKAVIASGFSETDRVREAQRLGAGQYLKKPYTLEKVGVTVKTELAK